MSVMGIYQTDMIFPAIQDFPVALPRFGILIKYYEEHDAHTEDILVRVFLPGDPKDTPSVVMPFNRKAMAAMAQPNIRA